MTPPKKKAKHQSLLPSDALRCIWMNAGLVAYKLCDRELVCEGCRFDMVMRGQGADSLQETEPEAFQAVPMDYHDDRRYHEAHTWAKPMVGRRVRIGLDGFVAEVVKCVNSVVLPPEGSLVSKGRVGCWIIDDFGSISLKMPVSGRVLAVNHQVRRRAATAVESPYDAGWLIEVTCEDPEREMAELLSAAGIREQSQDQIQKLKHQAVAYMRNQRSLVSPTLADGGERLVDLRKILGPHKYRRLILQFLS